MTGIMASTSGGNSAQEDLFPQFVSCNPFPAKYVNILDYATESLLPFETFRKFHYFLSILVEPTCGKYL